MFVPTRQDRPRFRSGLWLRRHRPRGRRWFVWYVVVLRFGLPAAALATLLRALSEPFATGHFLAHVVTNAAAGIVGGYIAGRVAWDLVVNRDGRSIP